jgi:hypothetical protein
VAPISAAPPKAKTKAPRPVIGADWGDVAKAGAGTKGEQHASLTPGQVAQAQYGNSEVSRVAAGMDATHVAASQTAGGTLPASETVAATSGDGKDAGGGGTSDDTATEPKATGADAATDTEAAPEQTADAGADKAKKTDTGGKGAAATDAADGEGDAKGKTPPGAVKEGGATEEADGEAEEDGAGVGGDVTAETLGPPPAPRLEGTQPVVVSPPSLDLQQLERVRSQTGFTLADHYARIQVHLDRLSARAQSEQLAIVLHVQLIEAEVRRDLENASALIAPAVGDAIDRVRAACAAARAAISTASKEALDTIEANATDADRKVDEAKLTTKDAVENAVLGASPQIRDLYEETMKPLRTLLEQTGEDFKKAGTAQGKAMVTEGAEIGTKLTTMGGSAIDLAMNEKRAQAAADQAKRGQVDLEQAGARGAQDIVGQEATLGMSFLLLVNPVAVKVEKVGAADAAEAESKGGEVRLRLATDYERSRGFVEETAKRALKALDAMERAAVKQLDLMGHRLEEMARARRESLCHEILAGQQPGADAWAQQMERVNQLVRPGEILDWRPLEPRFLEAMDSLNALSARQRLDFDAKARSGFDETRAGMDGDRRGLDEAAESYVDSARETGTQAATMRQVAATFADGFRGVAQPASSMVGEFRAKTEEKLGQSVEDTRKEMGKLLGQTKTAMKKSLAKFDAALGSQVTDLEKSLTSTFSKVGIDVIQDLADRAGRAFRAMDRVGTDEGAVFDALRGMTPKYGAALEAYWNLADHAHDLPWWLWDELSDDEYWAAYYDLKGDPVKGARYELSASLHWYGDDVDQMEKALRALSPEQLEQLRNDDEFKKVKVELQGSLTGTNLQVTNALMAGRTARADALRLKEKIDAARAAGDDDTLHTLLSQIDPHALPEVRREFADVLAGHAMTDKPPAVADDAASQAFKEYITRPVTVYEPTGPHGEGVRERTLTLSDPSKKLAEALATTGEGSPDARAARLAYEVTRGGKPRHEQLAKALDDPELVKARQDPALTDPKADPRDVARAQAELKRLQDQRAQMLEKFAELRGADEAIRTDPARAQEFTETAVADMFGDDKLGRELGTSMVRDGRANPAVAIKFAVRDTGTNEDLIRHTLRGMSPAEIDALKQDYTTRFGAGNPNALFDDLGVFQNADTAAAAGVAHGTGGGFFTELSGDERQEVEELLLGIPQNDRDRWRLARLKYEHQKGEGSTWVTDMLVPSEADAMVPGLGGLAAITGSPASHSLDMNKTRMEEMVAAAGGPDAAFDKDGNFKGVPGRFSADDFRLRTAATGEMAENYKHHIDSLADMITGAIAIIGAIVGTVVVTVLTLGTATPLVVGLWAAGIAAATGAAAMATNYALKGSRYGWEQAAVDGALTLLDAATAGVMAGAGAKAARATAQLSALKAAARTPAQAAAAERLAQQHAQKELARGFVRAAAGAGVSGTARTAMTDGTWDEGFLEGLGTSIGGGVKAAAIGVATHGTSTAFSRSGFGQKLGQSTSYLGRGMGAGLGGAFGGMAGRGTELTLDALGGHQQGTWYEALGSIALAGGRGFAENFGQGMAEVPKARRDAAQAELDRLRGQADNERVARFGMGPQDEASDLKFRRMAATAAKLDDPKTNLKAFLADLDAAVATDRALVEAHRQLMRQFRKEALAAIPPERRAEFADVPIRVMSDAEFERLTGSLSGRAVTLIVDGEAQIVVRKNASPDVLREEGIHVLQSRDPRWRERIARLDEKNLGHWNEFDLETKLSLYRDKLEVELDGQERLRQSLLEEAEQTPDPARRAALLARAEEAEATHAALLARRDEVDLVGPEQLARIRNHQEDPPQYLREPARLFAKKRNQAVLELHPEKTPKRATALEHDSPEVGTEPRRPGDLQNSTWEDDYPGHRLYQVGDAWTEPETYTTRSGGKGVRQRWYRMVEVTDVVNGVEVVVDRRREILQLGRNRRWQQRGSESSAWGTIFEKASRLRTLAKTRSALGREIQPDTDPVVPIGAIQNEFGKPLGAQHGGGAGFDDVVFHFREVDGKTVAHIVIVEAKGYRRSLTLQEFSAITANLQANLDELQRAVVRSNLSDERIAAVTAAIQAKDFSFDVQISSTTKLGQLTARGSSILSDIVATAEAWRQLGIAQQHLADLLPAPLSPGYRKKVQADIALLTRLRDRLEAAYAGRPFGRDDVPTVLAAILGGTRVVDAVQTIAGRHGLDVFEQRPLIQRSVIDVEGLDKPYVEAARLAGSGSWTNLQRSAGVAIGLAEEMKLADRAFKPTPTAATTPADVVLVRSGTRSLAVTRPDMTAPTAGTDSAASRQLVDLLRNGVALHGGGTALPDHVMWDTAGAKPIEIGLVLEQVRDALATTPGDLKRLRVMVDGAVATDEAGVRHALAVPDGVIIEQVTRPPHGSITWVLSFDPQWVPKAKAPRK